MPTLLRASAAAAVLLTVVLAGCSGSGSGSGSPSATETGSAPSMPTSAQPKPATTSRPPTAPVTPSQSGNVDQTVPSKTVSSRPPVSLDKSAQPTTDVVVSLPSIKAIEAKGQGPGEVSGPAVAVTVKVANNKESALDLSQTVVNLTAANGDPGSMMTGSPAAPLPATLKPGKSATGVYVFAVPKTQRDPVKIEVSIDADTPVAVFRGNA